ncbi:hypothetical protein FKM82_024093 [Ascaphus truei]
MRKSPSWNRYTRSGQTLFNPLGGYMSIYIHTYLQTYSALHLSRRLCGCALISLLQLETHTHTFSLCLSQRAGAAQAELLVLSLKCR